MPGIPRRISFKRVALCDNSQRISSVQRGSMKSQAVAT